MASAALERREPGSRRAASPKFAPGLTALEGDDPTVDVVERVAYENDEPTTPEVQKLRDKIKQEMNSDSSQDYEELQEVLKSLRNKAEDPSMGRTLRRLDIPSDVTYRYYGKKTAGNGNLSPQQNNEFAGEISGLKEDVDFVVKGADFSTLRQKIRLIPPPTLRRLGREQAEPAYLHHALPAERRLRRAKGKLQR